MTTSLSALRHLRQALAEASFEIATEASVNGAAAAARALRILDDHILPRLEASDAPLLCVIGGSTGSGKSTLLNSLVGENLSTSSVVRPTTRHPVLVHRAEDTEWFMDSTILPALPRMARSGPPAPHEAGTPAHLELRATATLPEGLAILDAPDVDSVVDENRALARQMLDAADLWVFVTTAARYADAVPWSVLGPAAARGVLVAIVLNRVPQGAREQIAADLTRLMGAQGLSKAPLFVIDEHPLEDARLSDEDVAPVLTWLHEQSADAQTRAEVAQRAVAASVAQVLHSAQEVRKAQEAEEALRARGHQLLNHEVDTTLLRLIEASADGTLLRGEVVARWQEIVGAADFTRSLTRTVATVRDRITSYLTGKPAPVAPVEDALEAGLSTLIEDELMRLREDAEGAWRADQWLSRLLPLAAPALNARELALDVTHEWQAELLEIVRTQGASKRTGARIMAIGVNVVAVALMIVIFASTGGITGMELGVAGASAAVSQKLLEAIFGDQAVRTMTKRAQELLREHLADACEQMVAGVRATLSEAPGLANDAHQEPDNDTGTGAIVDRDGSEEIDARTLPTHRTLTVESALKEVMQ